jgi:(S)-ureidoglycine aminohydrolase
MELFGHTRSHVARDHALIEPASFVTTALTGWERTRSAILISPRMGARFTQYLAMMEAGGAASPAPAGIERFVYVLEGSLTVQSPKSAQRTLDAGGFAFLPPDDRSMLRAPAACRLNLFEKRYSPRNGTTLPTRIVGQERDVKGEPFLGDAAARLQVLLPDEPAFDLAVNIFRFDPGAALPFVEVHVMEHGLLMIAGQGVYRLSDRWYPVRSGDVIWMAPFCPQWFVAMGKEPAGYLYCKDVNRDPIEGAP